jgi:hypothetical protein
MKILGTGAVVVFSARTLAERFAVAVELPSAYRVVRIEEVGAISNPYPDNWAKTNRAVLFDSESTLEQYLENRGAFEDRAQIIMLQGSAFVNHVIHQNDV